MKKLLKGTILKFVPDSISIKNLPTEIKIAQSKNAIKNGATQLDIVMAVDALIENDLILQGKTRRNCKAVDLKKAFL